MAEVYINGMKQISVQKPLCEDWFSCPNSFEKKELVFCQDPDFKDFLPSSVLRRNSAILKRAMVVSKQAFEASKLDNLDSVIIGSGLGCVESTENFLKDLVYNGEDFLKPSYFMQSTHNTIASVIGVYLKCNGYNSTYCHNGLSFENALFDAFLQIKSGKIQNAFVGGFDEMSQTYFQILKRQGYLNFPFGGFAGQASCGGVVSNKKIVGNTFSKISYIDFLYSPKIDKVQETLKSLDYDFVICGYNGNKENDKVYNSLEFLSEKGQYKNVFGESYSAVSYAVMLSDMILKKGFIPKHFCVGDFEVQNINKILIFNHYNSKEFSFILVEKC